MLLGPQFHPSLLSNIHYPKVPIWSGSSLHFHFCWSSLSTPPPPRIFSYSNPSCSSYLTPGLYTSCSLCNIVLSVYYFTWKNNLFFISQLMSVPLLSLLLPSFFTQDVKYTCYVLFVIALYCSLFVSYPISIFLFNFKSREKLQWFILYSYWPINLHFALFTLPVPPHISDYVADVVPLYP